MPLSTTMVGASTQPITHDVDARWIMSYAAGLDDRNPRYLDTHAGTVVAHPVFPVCLEWPVILSSRGCAVRNVDARGRGVRGTRPAPVPMIRAGRLTTHATVIRLQISQARYRRARLDTVDESGALVCHTYQLGISRDVDVIGPPRAADRCRMPQLCDASTGVSGLPFRGASVAAHAGTECARI
jgi:hypothetical protein